MAKSLRRAFLYALVRGLMIVARIVPRRVALGLFATLGATTFLMARKERRKTEINLALAMPELPVRERRRMARRVWMDLGRNSLDALRLTWMSWNEMDRLVRVEGLSRLEEPLSAGRGVIVVTGHIGNWEMLAAYFSMRGYPVSVLARPLRNEMFEKLIDRSRRSKGMRPISRIGNVKAAYSSLRRGDVLGVLIDQDTSVKGVFCTFFGRPAYTPAGPAYLALRTGAAVVPMGIHLQHDGTHLVRVEEPVDTQSNVESNIEDRVQAIMQRCTDAIEKLIRHEPSQWVWMHERWKTRQDEIRTGEAEECECVA